MNAGKTLRSVNQREVAYFMIILVKTNLSEKTILSYLSRAQVGLIHGKMPNHSWHCHFNYSPYWVHPLLGAAEILASYLCGKVGRRRDEDCANCELLAIQLCHGAELDKNRECNYCIGHLILYTTVKLDGMIKCRILKYVKSYTYIQLYICPVSITCWLKNSKNSHAFFPILCLLIRKFHFDV